MKCHYSPMNRQLMKAMITFCTPLLCFASAKQAAGASEIAHGTVIVIFFSKSRVILAADSRVTYTGAAPTHEDRQCKVADLGKKTIFSASGFTKYTFEQDARMPKFDVYQEARRAALSVPSEASDRAKSSAEIWARRVKSALDTGLRSHPIAVMSLMHGRSTQLAGAIFAGQGEKGLSVYYAALRCACDRQNKYASIEISAIRSVTDGVPAAAIGTAETMDLFTEVAELTTPRGIAERDAWGKAESKPDRDAYVTVRTGEFILRNSKDSTVGGPINAIELTAEGDVRWVKREKNCQ